MAHKVDERLKRLLDDAERDNSLLAPADAKDRKALRRRLKSWGLITPLSGLYVRASLWRQLKPDKRALMLVRGLADRHPTLTFCGPSAALLHGLDVPWSSLRRIHVLSHSPLKSRDTRQLACHRPDNPEIRVVSGIHVTSFWRTVYDCMRMLDFPEALAVADSAMRLSGFSRTRLHALMRERYAGHPGIAHVTATCKHADARSESGGEAMMRARVKRLGFAEPALQVEVPDPMDPHAPPYRCDFLWRASDGSLVAGEFDGNQKYVDPAYMNGRSVTDVLLRDRRRESRVTAYGIKVLRLSFREMMDDAYLASLLTSFGIPRGEPCSGVPDAPSHQAAYGRPIEVRSEHVFRMGDFLVRATTYAFEPGVA